MIINILDQKELKKNLKFQESEILKYFTTKFQLEPLADNCTKVYVWHTRTQKTSIINPKKLKNPPVPDDHIEVWFGISNSIGLFLNAINAIYCNPGVAINDNLVLPSLV